jgi:hypothetical protein
MPITNTPLCGATHLGDCVADLAVYELCGGPEHTAGRFWSWRIGASRGKVYAWREDAVAAVREYIATMTEMSEVAGRVWEDRP